MPRTHTTVLNREDEDQTEVCVEYRYSPATRDHYDASIGGPGGWSPGDPAEVDIVKCWTATEPAVVFEPTPAEIATWTETIHASHDDSDEDDGDRAYDEWRDREAEDYVYTGDEDF